MYSVNEVIHKFFFPTKQVVTVSSRAANIPETISSVSECFLIMVQILSVFHFCKNFCKNTINLEN